MADNSAKKTEANRPIELGHPTGAVTQSLQVQRPAAAKAKNSIQLNPIQQPHNPKDGQPLSSPGMDPLLPEDDLATFFRNRDVASSSLGGSWGFLKLLLSVLVIVGAFMVTYNYNPSVRVSSNVKARKWFGLELSKVVPVFGPRAKKGTMTREIELQDEKLREQVVDGKIFVAIDPAIVLIRSGQWQAIDKRLAGKCARWEASNDCMVKGFYHVHRGLSQSARPMLSVPEANLTKLSAAERTVWIFVTSLIATDNAVTQQKFQQALQLLPPYAHEFRRILYDEAIVVSAVQHRAIDLATFLVSAKKDPSASQWKSLMAKWSALSFLINKGGLTPAIVDALFKEEKGSLRSDIRSIALFTPALIRAGQVEKFLLITGDAVAEATKNLMDFELQRKALQSHVRVLWSLGRRGEVGGYLARYGVVAGYDAFARHFSASMLLLSGNPQQYPKAATLLGRLGPTPPWETIYAQGYALIRSGQAAKATSIVTGLARVTKDPNAVIWAGILRGEWLLSQRKFKEAENVVTAFVRTHPQHVSAADILRRAYEGQGMDREAGQVRMKMDDVRSKTGYWSSPEMLGSPLGPLALLR